MSALRKEMRKTKLIERYTFREILREMETLARIKYTGKFGSVLTKLSKPQREILDGLEIIYQNMTELQKSWEFRLMSVHHFGKFHVIPPSLDVAQRNTVSLVLTKYELHEIAMFKPSSEIETS